MPANLRKSKKPNKRIGSKGLRRARSKVSVGESFEALAALQHRLRAPGGCPWDREQTHHSLKPFLIEEAYEALDAMEIGESKKFAEELGDLLLQVVFHAELAKEQGQFDIADVIRAVHEKMVRRHPHVFGTTKARTSAQVLKNWEQIKAEERAARPSSGKVAAESVSALSALPRNLPALLEGYQMTRRAANIGFDWTNMEGVIEKLNEEILELREELAKKNREPHNEKFQAEAQEKVEEEMGDLLFAAVNVARFAGIDPEVALKRANRKFMRRFQWMEQKAEKKNGRLADVPRADMEELWNQSKVHA
ncbi:MAG TPA: nucleoside triphosphate pyrophosphohydrolase [Candidatus Acidoferrales bacterium]|nr:nucleoside triphosphate pyrophosphohydrolase [Candidatus Acidoferrales bacterium]